MSLPSFRYFVILLRSGNIDRQIKGAIIPCPIFFLISWNLVISLLGAYINYRLTCILKVGHPGANLNLLKHPLDLPVGASPQDTPTWWGCPPSSPWGEKKKLCWGRPQSMYNITGKVETVP